MSIQNKISYSVVVPVYNGESTLKNINEQLITFFRSKQLSFELIYVDDRSNDDSWKLLNEIHSLFPNEVTIIRFTKNYGQHKATMCGIEESKGEFVITIDDDLEQSPLDVEKLIEYQQNTGSMLTYGIYPDDKSQSVRKVLTRFYKLISKVEGKEKGKGSSFRLISKQLTDKVKKHNNSFLFIDEIFLWYIPKAEFVKLTRNENKQKSRYSLFKLIRMTLNVIIYTTTLPLHLFIFIGFSLSSINFIVGLYFLFKKFFYHAEHGFTSIIVSILFITGIILIGMGILGVYIARIYSMLNKAPSYNIDEKKC